MWFIYLMGLCIAILMVTGTAWVVIYAIGTMKSMLQDIKNGELTRRSRRW